MPDITAYLETVGEQIRWKRARQPLLQELETHLQEQAADCADAGAADPEAEAVRQMGDPVQIGQELDRIHRPSPQWKLLLLVGLLGLLGVGLRIYTGSYAPRVLLYFGIGLLALCGTYLLDFSVLGRHARAIYWGTILVSLLSLWCSPKLNNISYYTRYLTLLYPLVYALFLFHLHGRGWNGFLMALLGILPLLGITALVPNLSGTVLLLISGVLLLLTAVRNGWFQISRRRATGILLALAGLTLLLLCLRCRSSLAQRIAIALQPEQSPDAQGYLPLVIREASAHAGLLHLPPAFDAFDPLLRDFLPAVLIAATGWLPFLLFCAALFGLLIAAFCRWRRQKNQLGRMVALSILLTLSVQTLASLISNLGYPVFFNTPCVFLDGSFQSVLSLTLIGVLLSVFRQESIPNEHPVLASASMRARRIRWENGSLIITIVSK